MHHSGAVVAKTDQPPPACFDVEPEFRGAGIERIFEQLLHDARWTLHHFTGGNLVSNVVGEDTNAAHWRKGPGARGQTPARRNALVVTGPLPLAPGRFFTVPRCLALPAASLKPSAMRAGSTGS